MHAILVAAVVVELFTSQGCSSCPPADALISELRHRPDVIPLAFHVDYWDRLGWRDPFSSHQWTERQVDYVQAMRLNSAYTPQAVVNGRVQFVGSSKPGMLTAIENASHERPVGHVAVSATRSGNALSANVQASAPPGYDVMLAVFEDHVATNIGAGENSGRRAVDDAIVRKLQNVSSGTVTIPLDPSWRELGVAVFLQNRATHAIGNATSVILSEAKDLRLRR